MKELLMLNNTLTKYSINFSLIWHLQDGATSYTAKETIRALRSVSREFNGEDRIISKGLWPPRSSDLNPCDSYLWVKLKSVVYANNPHDLKDLK
jgi:hypothetical protein